MTGEPGTQCSGAAGLMSIAPADEPPAQPATAGDSARVASLGADVIVVAGRPRYHVDECTHLRGRITMLVSVRRAVEQGFTPCAWCEPNTVLLAQRSSSGDRG